MTDPTQPGQPSEEEIRAYLQQVREADPAAIVVQAYRMLGEGAELKLGRSDARVLIDAMAAVTQAVQGKVPSELVDQMSDGVRQLQTAQVQAEREGGQDGAAPESAGAGAQPGGQPGAQPGAGQPGGQQGAQPGGAPQTGAPMTGQPRTSEPTDPKITDRLWIPGRGPSK